MKHIDLSVLVPFKNEEENLIELHNQLTSVLKTLEVVSEVIYIDDGSTDSSFSVIEKELKESNEKNSKISYILISLRKNFGQTAAIAAGIDNSSGNLISILDADLQNAPADIPRFLDKLNEGYDAVFGWRRARKDATIRSFLSRSANGLINWVFAYPYHDVGCSARVVKREYITDLELYGELHRIMPVLIYLKGAKIGELVVTHRPRKAGKSKYGFERIAKTVVDLITIKFLSVYGTRPAYVFGIAGLGSICISFLSLILLIFRKVMFNYLLHQDAFFFTTLLFFFFGVQFIMMGLLAEFVMRTYFESQKKLIYEVKNKKIF